jgi:hypothetical protein
MMNEWMSDGKKVERIRGSVVDMKKGKDFGGEKRGRVGIKPQK